MSCCSTAPASSTVRVYRSTDDAESFQPLGSPVPSRTSALYSGATGAVVVGHWLGELSISRTEGVTWQTSSAPTWGVVNDALDLGSGRMLVATDDGVARSTDGGATFAPASDSINGRNVTQVVTRPGQPLYVLTFFRSLHRSDDGGQSFIDLSDSAFHVRNLALADDGTLYASHYTEPRILRSSDRGASWTDISPPGAPRALAILARGADLYVAEGDMTIAHSSDRGATWTEGSALPEGPALLLRADSSGGVIAGTMHRAYRSSDHGRSWTPLPMPVRPAQLEVAPDGTLVGGAADSLVRSTADGSWTRIPFDTLPATVGPLAFDRAGALLMWGGSAGMLRSTDDGASWSSWPVAPFGSAVTGFAVADDGIVAGTLSAGLLHLRATMPPLPPARPERSAIVSISPNPMRDVVEIVYDLAADGTIALELYNPAGELIWLLDAGERTVGRHVVAWSAIDVADGAYIVSLRVGTELDARGVVVID